MIVLTVREGFGRYMRDLFLRSSEDLPAVQLTITTLLSDQFIIRDVNSMLVVDVSGQTPAIMDSVRRWCAARPGTDIITVMPWINPRAEADLALSIARVTTIRNVMSPEDCNPKTWHTLVRESGIARVAADLRQRLVLEVSKNGKTIVEPNRILGVLEAAPRVANVEDYCRHTGIERRSQERRLRIQHQRQTKDLLVAFRWLWAVALREAGWRPGAISHALGYTDSSEAAKCLFRTVPVGMKDFVLAGTEKIITVYAAQLLRTLPEQEHEPLPDLQNIAAAVAGKPVHRLIL